MRLLIKQRVFSWTDTFDIYDEFENRKYYVKTEMFRIGHVMHVYSSTGTELGVIRQKLFTFLPTFEIEMQGHYVGSIRKSFSFFIPKYDIDFKGYHAEGDLFGWDYDVYNGNRQVIHISKKILSWGDTYVLDFNDAKDEAAGLLLVLAIDATNCSSSKND